MCTCHQYDGEFWVAVLSTGVLFFGILILKRGWTIMPTWMRYTNVLALMAAATGMFYAGQARAHAKTASTGIASVDAKSSTTRPSGRERLLSRRAASQPAKAASQPATSRPAQVATQPSSPTVTVYYFHRTMRCPTCRRLETLAKKAVDTSFSKELALGTVQWRAVNIQQNGNEHFVKDYQLEGPSLVLVKTQNGKRIAWQNMEKIWELVGSPAEYSQYVQNGLRNYLR